MSGDKLSQEQIDALLKAVNEGEEMPAFAQEAGKQDKFQEYDFNRPEKFGVEHLRSLQAIASTFVNRRHRRYLRVCVFRLT